MTHLSEHFALEELSCRCGCGFGSREDDYHPDLAEALEAIRGRLGRSLYVTSGARCRIHNLRVGGKPDSPHLYGAAVDLHAPDGRSRYEILEAATAEGVTRIGIGRTFVHVDIMDDHDHPARVIWPSTR